MEEKRMDLNIRMRLRFLWAEDINNDLIVRRILKSWMDSDPVCFFYCKCMINGTGMFGRSRLQ